MCRWVLTLFAALLLLAAGGCRRTPTEADRSLPDGGDETGPTSSRIEDGRMSTTPDDAKSLTPELLEASKEFKAQEHDRREPAKKLLPVLVEGTPSVTVQAILGPPREIVWDYVLFYSQMITIIFDDQGCVTRVMPEPPGGLQPAGSQRERKAEPEVIAAMRAFKTGESDRQEAAEKLLPLIEAELSRREVEELLGPPDQKTWVYTLLEPSVTMLVRMSDDKVASVETPGLEEEEDEDSSADAP